MFWKIFLRLLFQIHQIGGRVDNFVYYPLSAHKTI